MTDIINDIFLPEDPSESSTIDARDFFPKIKLDVVSHNTSHIFDDIRSGKGKVLNVTKKHTLTIKKPGKKGIEDLYNQKKYVGGILTLFSKNRIIRTSTISILEPLSRIPFNTPDVRAYEAIISTQRYPDIYKLPSPLARRARKAIRRHRRHIAIGTIVLASLSVSVILLSFTAKNYVEKKTIYNYNRIAALKDMRDMDTISKEMKEIHDSFENIALIFSPFRAVLDNRFYSHPQVHLASNVIYGGLTLSDSIEQGLAVAKDFTKELQNDTTCPNSFFGSGSLSADGCGIKITDFLKRHKSELEKINQDLGTTLAYYAGIESLGNPLFDEKLEKNMQSLLGIKEILTFSLTHFDDIIQMLGDTKPEQYMILNQNQDELRANGGFPGSILSFELYKGRIQKFEKHDVYDYDWKLYPYKETPPSGLE